MTRNMEKFRMAAGDMGRSYGSERPGVCSTRWSIPIRTCVTMLATVLLSSDVTPQTWRKAFGALGQDQGVVVRWIEDGTILVGGSTGSFGAGGGDIYLLGLDGNGIRSWSVTIGGLAVEDLVDLVQLPGGDLLLVGNTNAGGGYDGLLVRTDPFGNVVWERTYGSEDWDFLREVLVTGSGEVMLVGQSFRPELGGEVWVLQVDMEGEVLEEWFFGGAGEQDGRSICEVPGGFVIAGSTGLADESDGLVIRIEEDGSETWSMTYGGDSLDVFNDVLLTSDGGLSMMGTTHSFSQWEEAYHVKADADGEEVWYHNWGQVNDQGGAKHLELASGEFISIGYTKTSGGGGKDMFLLKSDVDGWFVFGRTFGGQDDEIGAGVDLTEDGFVCVGWTQSYGAGGRDVFVVRTDASGTTATEFVGTAFDPLSVDEVMKAKLSIVPNPSSGEFRINGLEGRHRWTMLDASGRLVASGAIDGGETMTVDVEAGIYMIRAYDMKGAMVWTGSLILIDR